MSKPRDTHENTLNKLENIKKENIRLKEQLKQLQVKHTKTESDMTELLNATFSILETNNFQKTARKIFDACARSIGAKAGYVALLNEEGDENELLFLESGGMPCTVDHNLPMPVRGLRAEAYETGKVVYDNDFMNSEWVKFMPDGHMDLPNVLFAPLNVDDDTVGILGFSNKDDDFTDEDARLAAAFGEYAAIALKNSKFIEELESYTTRLKEINATKDHLFSIISHDLKSPFNAILGYSDLIMQKSKRGDFKNMQRMASVLNTAVENSHTLLNNLLQWSRIQTGRITYNPAENNLQELVDGVIDLFELSVETKGQRLSKAIQPDLQGIFDCFMMETVVRNLITNAIKFTPSGGNIYITATGNRENIEIIVEDTGKGISPGNLENILQPDVIVSTKGTNNERGTGLGLVLCRDFINRHHGTIDICSEIEKGTVVTVTIPTVPPGSNK